MTTALPQTKLIGVDWGLTHLRAYCIGKDGEILQQRESAMGVSAVRSRGFAAALRELIADWLVETPDPPLYLCGMVGSRNGWCEAPYSLCPARIEHVAASTLL